MRNTIIIILSLLLMFSCGGKSHESKSSKKRIGLESEMKNIPIVDYDKKLKELNIKLTKPSPPVANYVNITQSGNLLFLAGKGPSLSDGSLVTGKVGQDLTVKEGYVAARLVGIAQLSVLKDYLGDLNKIKRILKVKGMVNSTNDFTQHPEVINGYSDLMVEIFGQRGKHARAAVGMGSLPRNIAVEIEMIVETY